MVNGRPERPEGRHGLAGRQVVDLASADPDPLAEDRDGGRLSAAVTDDFEDRERPSQQRLVPRRRLDHDELAGERRGGDIGGRQRDDVVIAREAVIREHGRGHVDGHLSRSIATGRATVRRACWPPGARPVRFRFG
jgi:hypothetical protein